MTRRLRSTLRQARSRSDSALNRLDDYLWTWGVRRYKPPTLVRGAGRAGRAHDRRNEPFDYRRASTAFQHPLEIEGRLYNYVFYPGETDTLCIHFSAFFEESGERRRYRDQFRGYFHRMRMFWPLTAYSFLFLVDTFGAEGNGSYYKGEDGDFFVERATDSIIGMVAEAEGFAPDRTVTIGSSMGATGALRFGLRRGFRGIVAVCPHVDLDVSALYQNRLPHVAAILGSADVTAPEHTRVTREIRDLAGSVTPLPRLAIQSMLDDHGVHQEQVLPLVDLWRNRGGEVTTDFHGTGGHTSDYATVDYFVRSIEWCLGT